MWYKVAGSKSFWVTLAAMSAALLIIVGACSPAAPTDSSNLESVDETVASSEEGLSGSLPTGSILKTTANLNFRTGPSTGNKVIRVLAAGTKVTAVASTASNGFYKV
ncbi:MAG TPA: SH3 domain-containing protein, partial [Polyangiaceae bacterium]|nr:SH3 domain-containing protein [Polyangiaceae bacterium]